ncbi:rRNA maturation RNase YbeY [Litoribacter ruber]|uniref:rRNA maturation RNase YbeY n=1 Tax=Litoribacter ruber TaxID=702568 RepID=UPI001BDA5C10|nr:rRNA maturation RNase YbeY [Litoribacter ruber]MBT0812480.1 rRNA maturation RNase YbeY [Litoribacter ruber]
MAINFFSEDIPFDLKPKNSYKKWLREIAGEEGFKIGELSYIFCSDEYLYSINLEYLNHDTYTDIITFDNSEDEDIIEGDIFISIDRVRDNAKTQGTDETEELKRVVSHGLLHLMGYKDKTEEEERLMREKENQAIGKF